MASDAPTTFDAAVTALSLLASDFEDVEILAVLPNQDYDPDGDLADVVDVTFRMRGRPGTFQVHPLFELAWEQIALIMIAAKRDQVEGIYDGRASIVDVPVGPPLPSPFGSPIR